jgi:hypothetical protein
MEADGGAPERLKAPGRRLDEQERFATPVNPALPPEDRFDARHDGDARSQAPLDQLTAEPPRDGSVRAGDQDNDELFHGDSPGTTSLFPKKVPGTFGHRFWKTGKCLALSPAQLDLEVRAFLTDDDVALAGEPPQAHEHKLLRPVDASDDLGEEDAPVLVEIVPDLARDNADFRDHQILLRLF